MTKLLKPIAVKKLLGIRNMLRPEEQPWGACADAVNVLVDDNDRLEARWGYMKEMGPASGEATDLYGDRSQEALFAVIDGDLVTIYEDMTSTVVVPGLADTVLQWTDLGDRVVYAGATDAGVLVNREHWQPLRIPVPEFVLDTLVSPPELSPGAAGGQYQVTVTLTHVTSGVEGPAAPVQVVELTGDQPPVAIVDPPAGYVANQYTSEANGSVLYCNGVPLDHVQRDAESLPMGITALAAAPGGALYAAIHDTTNDLGFVFWTQPFAWTCWRLDTDYLAVPGKVVGLAALPAGVLVATEHAVWLWNGEALQQLAPYGAVAGRPFAYDQEGGVWLWTTRGLCTLTPDGWRNLTGDRVRVPPGTWCTTQILERMGHASCVVVTDGEGDPVAAYGAISGNTWAINLHNGEMTRFDNFEFRAFGRQDGSNFGLKADGIYSLAGIFDAGSDPIVARFSLHPTNFGDTTLKRCTYAYLTGCDEATLTVGVVCDGEVVGSYSGQRRIPLARGVKGEFWAFEVSDQYGGPLRLTGFEILVEPTTRRV